MSKADITADQEEQRKINADMKKNPKQYFTAANAKDHIKDRIIVNPAPDIPREGLFVSLNGYGYLVKAGFEIDIPRPIREMLDTRIRKEIVHGDDGKEYARDVPAVTYRMIQEGVNLPENTPAQTGG
jgi:hypothetical protein